MKRIIFPLMLILGIFLIVFSVLLVVNQVKQVKEFCDSINGTYQFRGVHLCNGELVYKYRIYGKEYWSTEINLNNLSFNYSRMEFNLHLYDAD